MESENPIPTSSPTLLPYRDTKGIGAADFYFGINATFRFIREKTGREGLVRYWKDLGAGYFAPVSKIWAAGGLAAVAEYWTEFFAAEPEAKVTVDNHPDRVVVTVKQCPAIHHLRKEGREILSEFCEHCYWVSNSIGTGSGVAVRVKGGNGSCRQEFLNSALAPAQDLTEITRCS
jgi:hypothetical protein